MSKIYLGDGVYADIDARGIVLTTENGLRVTNEIVLEPETLLAFEAFVDLLRRHIDAPPTRPS